MKFHIQLSSEYLQRKRFYDIPGQPLTVFENLHDNFFFFNISSEFFILQQLISSVSTFSLVHQRMIQGKENAAASLCDPTVNLYLRHQSEGVKSGGTFCGSELQKQNIFHFLTAFFSINPLTYICNNIKLI